MKLLDLPDEVLSGICKQIKLASLLNVRRTCKRLCNAADDYLSADFMGTSPPGYKSHGTFTVVVHCEENSGVKRSGDAFDARELSTGVEYSLLFWLRRMKRVIIDARSVSCRYFLLDTILTAVENTGTKDGDCAVDLRGSLDLSDPQTRKFIDRINTSNGYFHAIVGLVGVSSSPMVFGNRVTTLAMWAPPSAISKMLNNTSASLRELIIGGYPKTSESWTMSKIANVVNKYVQLERVEFKGVHISMGNTCEKVVIETNCLFFSSCKFVGPPVRNIECVADKVFFIDTNPELALESCSFPILNHLLIAGTTSDVLSPRCISRVSALIRNLKDFSVHQPSGTESILQLKALSNSPVKLLAINPKRLHSTIGCSNLPKQLEELSIMVDSAPNNSRSTLQQLSQTCVHLKSVKIAVKGRTDMIWVYGQKDLALLRSL